MGSSSMGLPRKAVLLGSGVPSWSIHVYWAKAHVLGKKEKRRKENGTRCSRSEEQMFLHGGSAVTVLQGPHLPSPQGLRLPHKHGCGYGCGCGCGNGCGWLLLFLCDAPGMGPAAVCSIPRSLCPLCSAGTERHELTSWKSFPSIFRFFSEALEAKNSSVKPTPTRRSNRIKYEEL